MNEKLREYLSQLDRLLRIYRHYGLSLGELHRHISRELGLIDLSNEIGLLPKRLYSRIFRNIHYTYSERLETWSAMIEYGYANWVEGLGKNPRIATEIALEKLAKRLGKEFKEAPGLGRKSSPKGSRRSS